MTDTREPITIICGSPDMHNESFESYTAVCAECSAPIVVSVTTMNAAMERAPVVTLNCITCGLRKANEDHVQPTTLPETRAEVERALADESPRWIDPRHR